MTKYLLSEFITYHQKLNMSERELWIIGTADVSVECCTALQRCTSAIYHEEIRSSYDDYDSTETYEYAIIVELREEPRSTQFLLKYSGILEDLDYERI